MSKANLIIIAPLVCVLTACGGGGTVSSSAPRPINSPIPTPVPTPTPTPTPIPTPVPLPVPSPNSLTRAQVDAVVNVYMTNIHMQNDLLSFITKVTPSFNGAKFTVPMCAEGTYTLEYNDNDLNKKVSAGDLYTITFNNCAYGETVYVSGGVNVAVGYASSPLPAFSSPVQLAYEQAWTLGQSTTFKDLKSRTNTSGDYDVINGLLDTSLVNALDEQKTMLP